MAWSGPSTPQAPRSPVANPVNEQRRQPEGSYHTPSGGAIVSPPPPPPQPIREGQPYSPWRRWPAYVIPEWVMAHPLASSGAKLLYGILAFHQGQKFTSWPGLAHLAKRLGRSEKQVTRCRDELVRLKWLHVARRDGHSSLFTLIGPPGGGNGRLPSPIPHPPSYVSASGDIDVRTSPPGSVRTSPDMDGNHKRQKRREAFEGTSAHNGSALLERKAIAGSAAGHTPAPRKPPGRIRRCPFCTMPTGYGARVVNGSIELCTCTGGG